MPLLISKRALRLPFITAKCIVFCCHTTVPIDEKQERKLTREGEINGSTKVKPAEKLNIRQNYRCSLVKVL